MKRTLILCSSFIATLAIAQPPTADSYLGGWRRCTPTLDVPDGASVQCGVTANSPQPMNLLLARIMRNRNRPVDQWSFGYGAATGGSYYAEEVAGSFSDHARYCEVVVDPADAQVEAYFGVHVAGSVYAETTTLGPCSTNAKP